MSSSSEQSDNDDQREQKSPTDLILSDTSLRNIFQLGYNSRSLTKNIINSIKFNEVIKNIYEYVKNDELTVRSYGPLLLGLVRIYDKKMKLILEDVNGLIKSKTTAATVQDKKEDRKTLLMSRKKNDMTTTGKKNYLNSSSSPMTGLSPMNEGVFSLMNNHNKDRLTTPSKQPNFDLISQDSKEFFRANQQQQTSLSHHLLSSNQKNNSENINQLPESIQMEKMQEINKFADYIFDQERPLNNDLSMNNNIDFHINSNEKDWNYSQSKSNLKKVSFKEIEKALITKVKVIPYSKRNAKLEYDEDEMDIDLAPETTNPHDDLSKKLWSNLKKKLHHNCPIQVEQFKDIKYQYLFPQLDNEEENKEEEEEEDNDGKINKEAIEKNSTIHKGFNNLTTGLTTDKKRISMDNYNNESTELINNISRLSLNKNDFSNMLSFNEKLDQIKEDAKDKDDISIDNKLNEQISFELNRPNDIDFNDPLMKEEIEDDNNDDDKSTLNELSSELQKNILRKKKSIPFLTLQDKLKVNYVTKAKLFYDLLSLAQQGEIQIKQETTFDNDSITIVKSS